MDLIYPPRDGNLIKAWVDGWPAFDRICSLIESARVSVWATVTFLRDGFTMPGGRGGLFDVLDAAVARGLDVRVLFWRHGPETDYFAPNMFWGSAEHREFLAARGSAVKIRWDRAATGFAQHQKTWLIDAAHPGEAAFVGGINCNPTAVTVQGHPTSPSTHDAYVEIAGPSATDVHHDFVHRWNTATERDRPDGYWPIGGVDDLPVPAAVSAPRGGSVVRIQRERSILGQYLEAIAAARHTIYIENQYLSEENVIAALAAACERGVEVIAVVPVEPDGRTPPQLRSALAGRPNFLLAGLVTQSGHPVYVHDKLMIVDDGWVTIGSANLHRFSLHGNAELNASIWDPAFARALRAELFTEHLGEDTSTLTGVDAFVRFRKGAVDHSALATLIDLRTY